jgi:hypothetical protein
MAEEARHVAESEEKVIVSPRVADVPVEYVPSTETWCFICGMACWTDDTMLGAFPPGTRIVCMPCFLSGRGPADARIASVDDPCASAPKHIVRKAIFTRLETLLSAYVS